MLINFSHTGIVEHVVEPFLPTNILRLNKLPDWSANFKTDLLYVLSNYDPNTNHHRLRYHIVELWEREHESAAKHTALAASTRLMDIILIISARHRTMYNGSTSVDLDPDFVVIIAETTPLTTTAATVPERAARLGQVISSVADRTMSTPKRVNILGLFLDTDFKGDVEFSKIGSSWREELPQILDVTEAKPL